MLHKVHVSFQWQGHPIELDCEVIHNAIFKLAKLSGEKSIYHAGLSITGAVMGSVLFRLLVAIALRLGLDPNDLKLVTAVFVFLALIAPGLLKRLKIRRPGSAHAQAA